jgi:hypothetical protein
MRARWLAGLTAFLVLWGSCGFAAGSQQSEIILIESRSAFTGDALAVFSHNLINIARMTEPSSGWKAVIRTGCYEQSGQIIFGSSLGYFFYNPAIYRNGGVGFTCGIWKQCRAGGYGCDSRRIISGLDHLAIPFACNISRGAQFDEIACANSGRSSVVSEDYIQENLLLVGSFDQTTGNFDIDVNPWSVIQDHGSFGDFSRPDGSLGAGLSGIGSLLGQIEIGGHRPGLLPHDTLLRLNRFDLRRGGGGSIVRSSEEPLHVASLTLGKEHQPKRGGEQRESKCSQEDVRERNNEVVVRVSPYNDVINPNDELRREDRFWAGIVYCIGGGLLLLMIASYIWMLFQFRQKQRGDNTRGHNDNGKPTPPH